MSAIAVSAIWAATLIFLAMKAEKYLLSKTHLETFRSEADALQKQIQASQEASTKAVEEKITQVSSRVDALLMHIKMSE